VTEGRGIIQKEVKIMEEEWEEEEGEEEEGWEEGEEEEW